jgi:hypothetical protein
VLWGAFSPVPGLQALMDGQNGGQEYEWPPSAELRSMKCKG